MSSPVAVAPPPMTSLSTHVPRNYWLFGGGIFSLAFAVFQITAIWWNKDLLQWFGGPVPLMLEHFWKYVALCVIFGALVAGMGIYALAGAGKMPQPPLLRTVLIVTTVIYLLRGLIAIPQAPIVLKHPEFARYLWFSVIALAMGVVHLIGTVQLFRRGRPNR